MPSTLPICVACRAYKWIVKGGEDVRTDERMEMILDVCNGLLARHPGAASHRLKVPPHFFVVAVRETMETVHMPMGGRECSIVKVLLMLPAARVRRRCTDFALVVGRRHTV